MKRRFSGDFDAYTSNYLWGVGHVIGIVTISKLPKGVASTEECFFGEVFLLLEKDETIVQRSWFTTKCAVDLGLFKDESDFKKREVIPRLNEYFINRIALPAANRSPNLHINLLARDNFQELEKHNLVLIRKYSPDLVKQIKSTTVVDKLQDYMDFLDSLELPKYEYHEYEDIEGQSSL